MQEQPKYALYFIVTYILFFRYHIVQIESHILSLYQTKISLQEEISQVKFAAAVNVHMK